ncbi:MAG: hypothetical protein ACREEJ_25010 [Ensifer adhaerens]
MLISDIKNTAYPLLRNAVRSLSRSLTPLKAAFGRLRYLSPFPQRFTGAYSSFEDAIDRWTIPSLSHMIETHPELGPSESAGFYFRLQ